MKLTDIFVSELRNFNADDYKRPRRVLILEDDPDTGRLLNEIISSEGCRVTLIDSADRAVELVEKTIPFTRIFVDLNLPVGPSGAVAIRRIRDRLPDAPITIITGFVSPELEAAAKEHKCDILQKGTFLPEDIKDIVRQSK